MTHPKPVSPKTLQAILTGPEPVNEAIDPMDGIRAWREKRLTSKAQSHADDYHDAEDVRNETPSTDKDAINTLDQRMDTATKGAVAATNKSSHIRQTRYMKMIRRLEKAYPNVAPQNIGWYAKDWFEYPADGDDQRRILHMLQRLNDGPEVATPKQPIIKTALDRVSKLKDKIKNSVSTAVDGVKDRMAANAAVTEDKDNK